MRKIKKEGKFQLNAFRLTSQVVKKIKSNLIGAFNLNFIINKKNAQKSIVSERYYYWSYSIKAPDCGNRNNMSLFVSI